MTNSSVGFQLRIDLEGLALRKSWEWSRKILREIEKLRASLENHSFELRIFKGQVELLIEALIFSFFFIKEKEMKANFQSALQINSASSKSQVIFILL
ncbi:hypothetical protein N9J85_00425 [bacterium]|nr:hypothetical protein [bacterium]